MTSAGRIPLPMPRLLRSFLCPAAALLLFCGCAATQATVTGRTAENAGTKVEGRSVVRVTFREVPVPLARVEWRRSVEGDGEPLVAVAETDRDGNAAFILPPGRYFIVVRWRKDGDYGRPAAAGDRYAYFGANPVYVGKGSLFELFIGLEEFAAAPPGERGPAGGTGVIGRLASAGLPVAGGRVHAYLRTDSAFRDLGFAASAPTGEDGAFVLELPPGKYYLLARKRAGGGAAGPMRKGDQFGFFAGNPVTVEAGRYTAVVIPVTSLKLRNRPAYSGAAAASFIEGRILDRSGRPMKGAYAALYDNPDLLNRPVFLSDASGEDGRYRVAVPVPGTYYLGARSGYGGAPAPGDLYGMYEGNPEHAVTVMEGDRLDGIDIAVNEVR